MTGDRERYGTCVEALPSNLAGWSASRVARPAQGRSTRAESNLLTSVHVLEYDGGDRSALWGEEHRRRPKPPEPRSVQQAGERWPRAGPWGDSPAPVQPRLRQSIRQLRLLPLALRRDRRPSDRGWLPGLVRNRRHHPSYLPIAPPSDSSSVTVRAGQPAAGVGCYPRGRPQRLFWGT
jgi:hypothetical protein